MLRRRFGIGGLLSLSCGATGASLAVFGTTTWWWLVVVFAWALGLGAGAIDAALNTYVAKQHSARAMQWMHAFFGVGVSLGPLIMTGGLALTGDWRLGYLIVGGAQGLLALTFLVTRGRWRTQRPAADADLRESATVPLRSTLRRLPAILGMVAFFLYVGVELGLGLWAFSFLTGARGVGTEVAGLITGSYWATFTVGRILAGWFTAHFSVRTVLRASLAMAATGLLILLLDAGPGLAVAGFALTGLAVAPFFPALMSDTRDRVGRDHEANTIGMQIAAAGLGAALVPALAGVCARHFGLGILPLFMLGALALLALCLAWAHRSSSRFSTPQEAS